MPQNLKQVTTLHCEEQYNKLQYEATTGSHTWKTANVSVAYKRIKKLVNTKLYNIHWLNQRSNSKRYFNSQAKLIISNNTPYATKLLFSSEHTIIS